MRYISANLIKEIDTLTVDALGNKIYVIEKIPIQCRTTEWTSDDVNLYGRDMTSSNRKVIFKPIQVPIIDIVAIEIDNNRYQIHSILNLQRWIMLIVKGWRI